MTCKRLQAFSAHLSGARITSRGSQRQRKFSACAARTEAVPVKELAARPSEPPSVGKHSGKAHGNIKQQPSLDSCSVSLVRRPAVSTLRPRGPGRMLERDSDAMNPEARCRADGPCRGGGGGKSETGGGGTPGAGFFSC